LRSCGNYNIVFSTEKAHSESRAFKAAGLYGFTIDIEYGDK